MTGFKLKNLNISSKLILSAGTLILIAITISSLFIGLNTQNIVEKETKYLAEETAYHYAVILKSKLETALNEARAISKIFESSININELNLSRKQSNKLLEYIINNSPDFLGIYVAFEPNAFDKNDKYFSDKQGHDKTGRFIPYWTRDKNGKGVLIPLINYEKSGSGDYFEEPEKQNIECIIDPYIHPVHGTNVLITSLVVPISNKTGKFIGIAGIDLNLEKLGKVEDIKIPGYESAYINFYSANGTIVGSKNKKDIGKNISSISKEQNLIDSILENKPFLIKRKLKTGDTVLSYGAPVQIGKTGISWLCVVNIPETEFTSRSSQLIFLIALIGILSAFFIIIGIFFVFRTITIPIQKAVKAIDQIAEGNLEVKIIVNRKDEIGQMQESFNKLIGSLKHKQEIIKKIAAGSGDFTAKVKLASEQDEFGKSIQQMLITLNNTLGEVNSAVNQVNLGTVQISQSSLHLSQGATEQASSMEEISSSLNEINGQSRQNAENAVEASNLAKQAVENAENGNTQMKELIFAMEKINNSSDKIKKIVKTIDDIAFQINLLALNANVEAARAGKYGKGFAVVAEEVRNLAVRSTKAAKETTAMVEESIKNIEQGNNSANTTAVQLNEIVSGSNRVAELLKKIVQASREQAQGIEQINYGLEQIDKVTQANTASAEESAAASEELAAQSQLLKEFISNFKLTKTNNEIEENILEKRPPQIIYEKKPVKQITEKASENIWLFNE